MIFIIILILLMFIVYKLYIYDCDTHEHMQSLSLTAINNEALCNMTSVYNPNNFAVSNANITTLNAGSFNLLPKGIIFSYYNTNANASVPAGWALCDGTNGTPDLRNKFIIGSDISNIGTTGGTENVKLDITNIPAHTHVYGIGNKTNNNAMIDMDWSSKYIDKHEFIKPDLSTSNTLITGGVYTYKPPTTTGTTTKGWGGFSIGSAIAASLAAATAIFNIANYSATPISVMPPYYALVYIMKL